jgi:hypothetical protein
MNETLAQDQVLQKRFTSATRNFESLSTATRTKIASMQSDKNAGKLGQLGLILSHPLFTLSQIRYSRAQKKETKLANKVSGSIVSKLNMTKENAHLSAMMANVQVSG